MEVQTTRLAVMPPVEALPVARAHGPSIRAADVSRAPDPVDSIRFTEEIVARPTSPAIESLQERRAAKTPSGVQLEVDRTVNRVIARIVNENNEVIKQIPPEEAVRIFTRFREVTGLLFDREG